MANALNYLGLLRLCSKCLQLTRCLCSLPRDGSPGYPEVSEDAILAQEDLKEVAQLAILYSWQVGFPACRSRVLSRSFRQAQRAAQMRILKLKLYFSMAYRCSNESCRLGRRAREHLGGDPDE